ncbi:MAG: DUF4011 domain-containing protein [Anaerovoracaceae bacterium]
MGNALQYRIETWKKLLLDFGKRNRLINFKETKRSNIKITSPSFQSLFELVAIQERALAFPFAKKVKVDEDGEEVYDAVVPGDIETVKSLGELQKTLKALRYKAITSIEEQGINTLFLAFGLLKWTESDDSEQILTSPLILVPVKLTIESLTSPYILSSHEDEVVVNPTLSHKLNHDFGIHLPEFDSSCDDVETYFLKIEKLIDTKDWSVIRDVNLTILSFLKINMYKDLERNEDKLNENLFITAIAGESEPVRISEELNNYDHDNNTKPIDAFQVVDADSSQQDAVLLSKCGTSFVLQGPPGTGKSQTITNIISEALADGKKVLFVSEKMAALQVVYKRLASVGLSDFCFALHSHKANKKEILRELANSITIDRKKVREEALTQLETLERKRNALNEYQKELHMSCSGLNCSIYTVNGKLAKFERVPEIIFEIQNTEKTTATGLNDRCYLLSEFSKTVGKRSEEYSQNAWRNATVYFLSNELRHDIDSNISILIPLLSEIDGCMEEYCKRLGLSIKPSLYGLDLMCQMLSLVGKSPLIPIKWIFESNIDHLLSDAEEYKKHSQKIVELQMAINEKYEEQIFNMNGEEIRGQLTELRNNAYKSLQAVNKKEFIISDLKQALLQVKDISIKLKGLHTKSISVADLLGIERPTSIAKIKFITSLSGLLLEEITPTALWFDKEKFAGIGNYINECQNLHKEIALLKQEVLPKFDKEVFEIDFYPILKRFRGEYSTVFRGFKTDYKNDIKTLKQYLSNSSKLSYAEAFDVLNKLKAISDKSDEIKNNGEIYRSYFGNYYNGLDTNWNSLKEATKAFANILARFTTGYVPEKLKGLLSSKAMPKVELSELCHFYSTETCDNIIDKICETIISNYAEHSLCADITNELQNIIVDGEKLIKQYESLNSVRKESASFDDILTDVGELAQLQSLYRDIEEQRQKISEQYDSYYTGVQTDWNKTFEALMFAKEMKDFIETTHLPEDFIEKICSDSKVVSYCKTSSINLINLKEKIQPSINWVLNLFNESEQLTNYYLKDLSDRLTKCKNKKHLLEEWVDYCSNRRKCEELGLLPYITQIEEREVSTNHIVDAYLKRFYRLWLDAILPQFPAVQSFRGRIHDQNIKEFQELDKIQFRIAQSRVRERIFNRMPDFDSVTSTRDEIGILKRELNKQRRLMPLRKLFNEIPNLLTSLRPCFMMSPLSVSVFLEAKSYDFDLVIFDEASQVHTEDAIGAIMRGKQVIIVGDTKQLPPTSFFTSALEDEDFDTDTEASDNDAGAYQSILDESVTVLPERSLRWHYRSRHEHLIAFSNIKIYGSSMITFPSSVEKAPDCGVEYIYVSNGVYDRGSKRNNINEAQKVADLVFNHYRKYPNRSLGVVTFSEAQQQAVDAAIRQKRLQNGMYEQFFMEDRDEPFFIKNLENVQGDERDTIIFSIGYAKDSNGIMYMNFGPLSKDGGHRRLNVAITRAKHNVKLVGSIVPTDIDTEKTSAEGVKLLRSYIEFAQQGIVALQKELSYVDSLDFDSPFEEAVYDFLSDNGYNVVTQVGCSGFRIDMAVKHPSQSGRFAIGIECDGATYHSARTARERDRLRQTVLEDMGWSIYRIWSTDWIKDQKTEEQKLITAIEMAFDRATRDVVDEQEMFEGIDIAVSSIEIEEDFDKDDMPDDGYGFIPYQQVNLSDYSHLSGHEIIKQVIELEQPIHFEELCRRVAPLFGNLKATSKVREGVEYQFRWYLAENIERKGDFITLKDFDQLQVRVPNEDDGYVRPIAYISDDELGKAMRRIAKQSYGITPDDLFVATAREFGYKRTGENIVSALRSAYEKMLNCGRVKEVDGKVNIL